MADAEPAWCASCCCARGSSIAAVKSSFCHYGNSEGWQGTAMGLLPPPAVSLCVPGAQANQLPGWEYRSSTLLWAVLGAGMDPAPCAAPTGMDPECLEAWRVRQQEEKGNLPGLRALWMPFLPPSPALLAVPRRAMQLFLKPGSSPRSASSSLKVFRDGDVSSGWSIFRNIKESFP